MAVKHWVCVLVGAPGPVHGAALIIVAMVSVAAPRKIDVNAVERYASKFDFGDIDSSFVCI
jgi:hypothetical protein